MVDKLFTNEDLNAILTKCCANQKVELIDAKLITLFQNDDDEVAGFMGDYYKLQLEFSHDNEKKIETFFVKTKPTQTEVQTEFVESMNSYDKEIFYCDFLLKEYEQYGFDTSFAPKCYLCKNGELIVLEDLGEKNFKLAEKYKFFDVDRCKVGLEALALYHAASMMYEEKKSKELGRKFRLDEEFGEKLNETFYDMTNKLGAQIIDSSIDLLKYMVKNLQEEMEISEDFVRDLTGEFLMEGLFAKNDVRKATGHGDEWYKNLFFKEENSKVTKCKLIDFQVLRYSYPIYDVLLFLHLNTTQDFRKIHKDKLLEYYYECMERIFLEHNFSIEKIYPKNDFEKSLKLIEVTAMFNFFGTSTFINIPDDVIKTNMFEHGGSIEIYSNSMKELFVSNPFFRKIAKEAVVDMYESYQRKKI